MEHIYSPWRSAYFKTKSHECVFCEIVKDEKNDEENMVIFRDKHSFGVMNRYPYMPAHFMVIPYKHVDAIEDLDEKTWIEMSLHVKQGVRLLKEEFNAQGVNIGMNLGKAAGAGIAEHVHYHVLPRWQRDTNFITTIGECRVNGNDFREIYEKILRVKDRYFILN